MRFLCCFFCLICLVSCSAKKQHLPTQQRLKLNLYCEPPTLDSRKAIDSTSTNVLLMLFEGLTRIGIDHQPVPAVAKEIEISDDQKTYTFYLRDCVWSNGDPVTAHDFVYTWNSILDPLFPSDFAQKLYVIKNAQKIKERKLPSEELGVSVINDYVLKVELEHPTPYFLELMAFPTFFPIHRQSDKKNPEWANDAGPEFISNGPFQLLSWEHENELVVQKNPLYWDASKVQLETINCMMVSDATTELHMFEANELDWAGSPLSNLPSEVIPTLKNEGKLLNYPVNAVYFYKLNTEKIPFNNKKIRQAFSYAIDRKAIIEHILQADQQPATGLVPPLFTQHPFSKAVPYFEDGNRELAKKLFAEGLQELGITKENLSKLTLSYNTNREHEKIAQTIQNTWQETFGITVELENFEWKVYLSKIYKQDFQIARTGWVGDFNDPISFLQPFKTKDDPLVGGNNSTQWENQNFQHLLDTADITEDFEKRLTILKEAESIIIDEMPVIPLYFLTYSYLKKSYVKNVYLSPLGIADFKTAYVDESDVSCLDRWKEFLSTESGHVR